MRKLLPGRLWRFYRTAKLLYVGAGAAKDALYAARFITDKLDSTLCREVVSGSASRIAVGELLRLQQ